VSFGVQPAARDANGLGATCFTGASRGLVRLAASRIHHHFLHVGLLHALEKVFEMTFIAPVGAALIHHIPFPQPLGQIAPGSARAGHRKTSFARLRVGPLQGGSKGSIRAHCCSSVNVWRVQVILTKSGDYLLLIVRRIGADLCPRRINFPKHMEWLAA
jgi:hypothetical protein